MGFNPTPITMAARGALPGRIVGLPMLAGDTLTLGSITIALSSANIAIANQAMNTVARTVNDVIYEPGQAIEFDLSSPGGTPIADSEEWITFAYTAPSGYSTTAKLWVDLVDYLDLEYVSRDVTLGDAAFFANVVTAVTAINAHIHENSPADDLPSTSYGAGQKFIRTGAVDPGEYRALDAAGNWEGPL